jgi:hypothetical protein
MSIEAATRRDHCIDLVLATLDNTQEVGWFITDASEISENSRINIPLYDHVTEGEVMKNAV